MISCARHDYLEIACMYKLAISLILKNGETLNGIAQNLIYNEFKQECILLEDQSTIVLDHIAHMHALVENPHFKRIDFI